MKHALSLAVSAALMSMSAHSAGELAEGMSKFDISSAILIEGIAATSINKNNNANKKNVTGGVAGVVTNGTSKFDTPLTLPIKGVVATSINKINNSKKPISGVVVPKFVVEKGLENKPYIYIVRLTDQPVATYDGQTKGLKATNPMKKSRGKLQKSQKAP